MTVNTTTTNINKRTKSLRNIAYSFLAEQVDRKITQAKANSIAESIAIAVIEFDARTKCK